MKKLFLLLLTAGTALAQPINPVISGGTGTGGSGGSATNVGVSGAGLVTVITNGSADFTVRVLAADVGAVTSSNAIAATTATNAQFATTAVSATYTTNILILRSNSVALSFSNNLGMAVSNMVQYDKLIIPIGDYPLGTNTIAPPDNTVIEGSGWGTRIYGYGYGPMYTAPTNNGVLRNLMLDWDFKLLQERVADSGDDSLNQCIGLPTAAAANADGRIGVSVRSVTNLLVENVWMRAQADAVAGGTNFNVNWTFNNCQIDYTYDAVVTAASSARTNWMTFNNCYFRYLPNIFTNSAGSWLSLTPRVVRAGSGDNIILNSCSGQQIGASASVLFDVKSTAAYGGNWIMQPTVTPYVPDSGILKDGVTTINGVNYSSSALVNTNRIALTNTATASMSSVITPHMIATTNGSSFFRASNGVVQASSDILSFARVSANGLITSNNLEHSTSITFYSDPNGLGGIGYLYFDPEGYDSPYHGFYLSGYPTFSVDGFVGPFTGDGANVTNLANANVVIAGPGVTVVTNTTAGTGTKSYTISAGAGSTVVRSFISAHSPFNTMPDQRIVFPPGIDSYVYSVSNDRVGTNMCKMFSSGYITNVFFIHYNFSGSDLTGQYLQVGMGKNNAGAWTNWLPLGTSGYTFTSITNTTSAVSYAAGDTIWFFTVKTNAGTLATQTDYMSAEIVSE